jgi:hypothetical protein
LKACLVLHRLLLPLQERLLLHPLRAFLKVCLAPPQLLARRRHPLDQLLQVLQLLRLLRLPLPLLRPQA